MDMWKIRSNMGMKVRKYSLDHLRSGANGIRARTVRLGFESFLALALTCFILQVRAEVTVDVEFAGTTACTLDAQSFAIDPVSGVLSLSLDSSSSCGDGAILYPVPVVNAESSASLGVSPTSVTTTGVVTVTLMTGQSAPVVGLSCVPDGYLAERATVVAGWTAPLCANCESSVSRAVTVSHAGGSTAGDIRFKARCAYTSPVHPRITTVLEGISVVSSLVVLP
jgi:hypothetical protein